MSKYSVNVEELQKAVAVSNHVIHQFEKAGKQLKDANNYLRNQTGFGINDDKITLSTQTAVLDLQKRNMERIRDGIQLIIDKTMSTAQAAKKEMESVIFEGVKDAAVIGAVTGTISAGAESAGAASAGVASTGASIGNAAGQANADGIRTDRKMFYNCTLYGDYDPRSDHNVAPTDKYWDTESSCMACSYAMLFYSLGLDAFPGDIYAANGYTNVCNHNYADKFGVQSSGPCHDGLYAGNAQGNEQRIRTILQTHPEGIIIGNNQAPHYVYAFLDENGNIKINDPGQVNPAIGWQGGEGISIDKTWKIESWGNVNTYITVSRL